MKNISEKIDAGVLNLESVPTDQLIQWAQESASEDDRNALGHEILYRKG